MGDPVVRTARGRLPTTRYTVQVPAHSGLRLIQPAGGEVCIDEFHAQKGIVGLFNRNRFEFL